MEHTTRILLLQRDLLIALRRSPTGTASIDDATSKAERKAHYRDGGKWRGIAVRDLADRELIEAVCDSRGRRVVVASRRPARHSGTVGLWRSRDAAAIDNQIRQLNRRLADIPKQPKQGNLFDTDQ